MFRNKDEQWRVQTDCQVGRKGRANRGKTHYLIEDLCFGKCVNRECGLKKWWTIGRRVWCATYAGRQMDRRFALHMRTGMLFLEMWMAIGCGGKIWRCSSAFVNGPQIADSSSSALFRLSNRLSSRSAHIIWQVCIIISILHCFFPSVHLHFLVVNAQHNLFLLGPPTWFIST